ncbi:Hypothetical protein AKI40_2301 [Enterobacter sp. FY-07]|nr:Hypothetical protein AKI40_2301 [Enterobacter sp. FY-07]
MMFGVKTSEVVIPAISGIHLNKKVFQNPTYFLRKLYNAIFNGIEDSKGMD